MIKKVCVPPDGGWGWIVVASHALHHLIAIPIMQTFGLLFKDTFNDLHFTAMDTSLIMNTNAALSMFMGIINGPLLRHLGYRKVSICGAFFMTTGVLLTAYAHTFAQYMITYGIITSLGIGMGLSSYPLALNSYFYKKRSIAAGYTMTICGLGPVLMPQLISFLLDTYGLKYAMVIVGGITGHAFISAVLLQPVEWHMKQEIVEDDTVEAEKHNLLTIEEESEDHADKVFNKRMAASMLSLQEELEIESKYGIDTPLTGSVLSLHPVPRARRNTITNIKVVEENDAAIKDIQENTQTHQDPKLNSHKGWSNSIRKEVYDTQLSKRKNKKSSLLKRIGKSIVKLLDLTLLKDRIFVNIVVGMSLAVFAELNFSILTPFIMADYDLSTQQIATFISVLSTADILFRFIAPYVSELFNKPVRIMYMWALLLLILSRFSLLLNTQYYYLLGCAAFLGLAKGFRTVYWSLVVPNYVPIERLAAALGLYSTLNGIFIWIGGPFLGIIRDVTGSYKKCIFVINSVTSVTLIMWISEFIYLRYKSKKKKHVDLEEVK